MLESGEVTDPMVLFSCPFLAGSGGSQATYSREPAYTGVNGNLFDNFEEMNMNTALWVIQAVLAVKLIATGFSHGIRQSLPAMQEAITRLGGASRPLLYLAALMTTLGGLGLILVPLLNVNSGWVPGIALVVAASMLASIIFHVLSRDQPKIFVSVILFAMALFVAYGRWQLAPF